MNVRLVIHNRRIESSVILEELARLPMSPCHHLSTGQGVFKTEKKSPLNCWSKGKGAS